MSDAQTQTKKAKQSFWDKFLNYTGITQALKEMKKLGKKEVERKEMEKGAKTIDKRQRDHQNARLQAYDAKRWLAKEGKGNNTIKGIPTISQHERYGISSIC